MYNLLGKEICTLFNKQMNEGYYKEYFDGNKLGKGMYVYVLSMDGHSVSKKMKKIK